MTSIPVAWTAIAAVAVTAIAAAAWAGWVWRWRAYERWVHAAAKLVQIMPPVQAEPEGAAVFWRLAAPLCRRPVWWLPRAHLVVEFQWAAGQLLIRVWVPANVAAGNVVAAVAAAWPGASCSVTEASGPLPHATVCAGAVAVAAGPPWTVP